MGRCILTVLSYARIFVYTVVVNMFGHEVAIVNKHAARVILTNIYPSLLTSVWSKIEIFRYYKSLEDLLSMSIHLGWGLVCLLSTVKRWSFSLQNIFQEECSQWASLKYTLIPISWHSLLKYLTKSWNLSSSGNSSNLSKGKHIEWLFSDSVLRLH